MTTNRNARYTVRIAHGPALKYSELHGDTRDVALTAAAAIVPSLTDVREVSSYREELYAGTWRRAE